MFHLQVKVSDRQTCSKLLRCKSELWQFYFQLFQKREFVWNLESETNYDAVELCVQSIQEKWVSKHNEAIIFFLFAIYWTVGWQHHCRIRRQSEMLIHTEPKLYSCLGCHASDAWFLLLSVSERYLLKLKVVLVMLVSSKEQQKKKKKF